MIVQRTKYNVHRTLGRCTRATAAATYDDYVHRARELQTKPHGTETSETIIIIIIDRTVGRTDGKLKRDVRAEDENYTATADDDGEQRPNEVWTGGRARDPI